MSIVASQSNGVPILTPCGRSLQHPQEESEEDCRWQSVDKLYHPIESSTSTKTEKGDILKFDRMELKVSLFGCKLRHRLSGDVYNPRYREGRPDISPLLRQTSRNSHGERFEIQGRLYDPIRTPKGRVILTTSSLTLPTRKEILILASSISRRAISYRKELSWI